MRRNWKFGKPFSNPCPHDWPASPSVSACVCWTLSHYGRSPASSLPWQRCRVWLKKLWDTTTSSTETSIWLQYIFFSNRKLMQKVKYIWLLRYLPQMFYLHQGIRKREVAVWCRVIFRFVWGWSIAVRHENQIGLEIGSLSPKLP